MDSVLRRNDTRIYALTTVSTRDGNRDSRLRGNDTGALADCVGVKALPPVLSYSRQQYG
ncbi:MAG: hypothetical protein LBH29_00760 [Elusimicrobiota bacterium]|nr:hypothetical protein [Elusimicrobiota bacterium]